MLPVDMREGVQSRLYDAGDFRYHELFESSPLHFAPGMTMKLMQGDRISDSIALNGAYDAPFSRWLAQVARRDGGLFVDVGANLGYYSLLWCSQNESNRVVAFEVAPEVLELLRHNVVINGLEHRIDVRPVAVGAIRGQMNFDIGPVGQTAWGGFKCHDSSATIKVDVVTLDESLEDREITLLKTNIQGADAWAIQGAERILRSRQVRRLRWEENKPRMKQLGIPPNLPKELLEKYGYVEVGRQRDSDIVNRHAIPKEMKT
jgi:FkbM family methyltransferase